MWLLPPVTVTVWTTFQFAGVNVSDDDDTVPWFVSLLVTGMITFAVGLLLSVTAKLLVVPLVAVTRGRPGAGRALWAAALATFAVSALHLSQLHRGEASWPVELVGHHASVPLAFAILYQDYRFALADLFLKRALSLLAIVAVAFAAIASFGVRSSTFARAAVSIPKLPQAPGCCHPCGRS